jgi:hypothetical protein
MHTTQKEHVVHFCEIKLLDNDWTSKIPKARECRSDHAFCGAFVKDALEVIGLYDEGACSACLEKMKARGRARNQADIRKGMIARVVAVLELNQ